MANVTIEPDASARPIAIERFPIRIEPGWRIPLSLVFGVRAENAWITLDDRRLTARFGRFGHIAADIGNIASYERTGPYHAITAFGVRRSIRGGDISFCGTARGGILLRFKTPISWFFLHPPAFTVTPEDMAGFVRALEARGIPAYQPGSPPRSA